MLRGTAVILVAAACGLGACGREPPLPLAQEQFVEVMVSLRRAALETPDQGAYETRKQEILKQAGVTEAQLRAYARAATRNPMALADAYDSIAAQVQRFHEPE